MTTIIGVDDTSSRSRYARNVSTAEVPVGHDIETAFVRGDETLFGLPTTSTAAGVQLLRPFARSRTRKDVTQEVFLSAWRQRAVQPRKGRLGAWLMGIARNRIIDNVRSEKRHSDRRADEDTVELSTEAEVDAMSDKMLIADALANFRIGPAESSPLRICTI